MQEAAVRDALLEMEGDQKTKQQRMVALVGGVMTDLNGRLTDDLGIGARPEAERFAVRRLGFFTNLIANLVHFVRKVVQPAVGHDAIHHSYDMYEAINLLAGSDLSTYEQIIVLLGGLCHDLGRGAEEKVFGKPMATAVHVWFSLHMTLEIGAHIRDASNDWEPEEQEVFEAMWRRVQGTVGAHFGPNATEDPLRWWVQSGDRLAGIFGIRDFSRNLACDMALRGARFWPDPKLSCAWGMAPFNNLPPEKFEGATRIQDSWTNVIHYVEVPLRTAYPQVNKQAEARATQLKVQAARLLISLTDFRFSEQYNAHRTPLFPMQIFAPEMVQYEGKNPDIFGPHHFPDKTTRFDKDDKVLPEPIWEEATRGMKSPSEGYDSVPHMKEWTIWSKDFPIGFEALMGEFLKRNAYTLSLQERKELISRMIKESSVIFQRAEPYSGTFKGLVRGVLYALTESSLQAEIERARLDEISKGPNPLLAAVADEIKDEAIFHQSKDPPPLEG